MNGMMKGMLLVLLFFYVISPIDLCPGPVDDVIFMILTLMMNRRTKKVDVEA